MKLEKLKWRYVLEAVGAISIVSSLIFVGLELRESQRSTVNARTVSRIDLGINVRDSISQYPDIWLRGNRGDDLSDTERVIYSNLIANWDAEINAIGLTALALGRDLHNNLGIMNFSAFLHETPGAQKQWWANWEEFRDSRTKLSGDPQRMDPVRAAILRHLEILNANSEN